MTQLTGTAAFISKSPYKTPPMTVKLYAGNEIVGVFNQPEGFQLLEYVADLFKDKDYFVRPSYKTSGPTIEVFEVNNKKIGEKVFTYAGEFNAEGKAD